MSKQSSLSTVANEAIDQLQVAREHLGWIDALGFAMSSALKSGHSHQARQLAGLTQYLAHDLNNVLDSEVLRLRERLTALELRA